MQDGAPLFTDRPWLTSYSPEDGNLLNKFYVPALMCAVRYERATGYFSQGALAKAALGLDFLIRNGGKMQLLVGCTLEQKEVDRIKVGYALKELAETEWKKRLEVDPADPYLRERLGWLAWLIAKDKLEIRLAIPLDEAGEPEAGTSIYHSKKGIITDKAGNQLLFTGSINETEAGWMSNTEEFAVSCGWDGGRDAERVKKAEQDFQTLWEGKGKRSRVVDFPQALRERLLQFLPKNDSFLLPPPKKAEPAPETETPAPVAQLDSASEPPKQAVTDEDRRRFWQEIADAPKGPGGPMLAVETCPVEPWPHQLHAYKRMLDGWPFRLLIADEVGLGKTIEAGMLLRYAWISGKAKRILILTPAGVMKQWQNELYEKFNLLVPIYDDDKLTLPEHHCRQGQLSRKVGKAEWTEEPLVIASSHLMRRRDRADTLLQAKEWDLVVLDEAHHARRKGASTGKNKGSNRLLALMEGLKDKTQALLMMTATPMQVHPVEVFDLLKLLGLPAAWGDTQFVDYFEALEANPNHDKLHELAKLFQAAEEHFAPLTDEVIQRIAATHDVSALKAKQVAKALREPKSKLALKGLSAEQRRAAIAILREGSPVRYLMSRHTRPLLRRYFKLGLLTSPIAERDPMDVPVALSPVERKVYDDVEAYIRDTYDKAKTGKQRNAIGFVMTIYRRRLASCFDALKKTLTARLTQLELGEKAVALNDEDLSQDEADDDVADAQEAAELLDETALVEEKDRIKELLKQIALLGVDSKFKRAVELLQSVFETGFDSAIVFTQYTDTMDYLKQRLADRFEGVPIGTFSGRGGEWRTAGGEWRALGRDEIKRRFREGQIKLLVCTDAAGEGLNLQSCGVLMNYDLPWNPMKVEQRIGRIDRIGQKHPKIRIFNLAYADTIEADIYFALSKRIDLFRGVVGKLQPILSQLPKEFERAALGKARDDETQRAEFVRSVEQRVDEAKERGFDIDAVVDPELKPPAMPPAPFGWKKMAEPLLQPALLPAGTEVKPLDEGSWSLRLPGMAEPARVTPNPALFDEHFTSMQLLWYGGMVFSGTSDSVS
ncbi:MAG: DEAD/DEAH box helicase family protein [Planctomycetes bacterium]|nr:DEAD/DEAH box helicase family protein [Planctomycetota bacterium]MCB9936075.1 DEAD/DEAH box helicase family protein [Planctomycetota bacterium]